MTHKPTHNDAPITAPNDDRFDIDPFARSLATSIRKIASPEGMVIALNGPWGSGKSSAVNLVRHHLGNAIDSGEITVINFTCWWFRGEEALSLNFFRELYAGLGPSLGDRFKQALPKIGARLLRGGSVVGAGIDLAGIPGVGSLASSTMNWLSGLIQQEDTIEKLHAELVRVLGEQEKRFLIVIDDIDRLAPDEALLIFRLVKSVGRLPNVIYLLVFDRKLAETIVADRYPSEGPHYLEKIIQASFDLPEPRQSDLSQQLLEQIGTLCGTPPAESDIVRFMNIFYDVILPEVRTPRDVVRLMNALSVTWPAVGQEVNQADFVGLETLRVFRPSVHRAVRGAKNWLCGARGYQSARDQKQDYDRKLLGDVPDNKKEPTKKALMRLFPRLSGVWDNTHYDDTETWAQKRLVCSENHFDAYFRFSLGDETLLRTEIDDLIDRAGDRNYIQDTFRQAIRTERSGGRTRASLLFDELTLYAASVRDESVEPLVSALFEIADELQVPGDRARGFAIGDNQLRLHWLIRRLTSERFDLARRSSIFMAACATSSLGWFVSFSQSAYRNYHPIEGEGVETDCLTTQEDAETLRRLALDKIRAASRTDELLNKDELPSLLFLWSDQEPAEVLSWTSTLLNEDQGVVRLAQAFTSHSWVQSMGDRVARRLTRASTESIERVLDRELFRNRLEALLAINSLAPGDAEIVRAFLGAWDQGEPQQSGRADQ